jgi:hypothetical protein
MTSSGERAFEESRPFTMGDVDLDEEQAAREMNIPMIERTHETAAAAVNQIDGDDGTTVYNYEHTAFGHYAVDLAAQAQRMVERVRARRKITDSVAERSELGETVTQSRSGRCANLDLSTLYLISVGIAVAAMSVGCSLLIQYVRVCMLIACLGFFHTVILMRDGASVEWSLFAVTNDIPALQWFVSLYVRFRFCPNRRTGLFGFFIRSLLSYWRCC